MIIVETTATYVLRTRTNRRVRWQYAEYGGRYESAEAAVEAAKQHYGATPFEYLIENMATDEETTGLVNWPEARRARSRKKGAGT